MPGLRDIDELDFLGGQKGMNERTVGRWCPENRAPVKNHVLKKEGNAKSVPSIPSRWETTIHEGKREVLGFGVNALRFDKGLNVIGPSPGSYQQQKSFHEEMGEKYAWGKRGTGGFASRSRRFGARSMPQMPMAGVGCPGPGAYNEKAARDSTKNPKDFNRADNSCVFAKPVAPDIPSIPGPGPGSYSMPVRPPDAPEMSAARASFKSTSSRMAAKVGDQGGDAPGPGEYYDLTQAVISSRERISGGNLNAVFNNATRKRIVRIHPDLPTADQHGREVLRDFADEVGRECAGIEKLAMNRVGPGHYDQNRDAMWEGAQCGLHGSSSFCAGPERVEWTSEEVRQAPGPGKYNPVKTRPNTLTSAVSAFDSQSQRGKYDFPTAPGPAYYGVPPPPLNSAKSFRLNSRRMWG